MSLVFDSKNADRWENLRLGTMLHEYKELILVCVLHVDVEILLTHENKTLRKIGQLRQKYDEGTLELPECLSFGIDKCTPQTVLMTAVCAVLDKSLGWEEL